MIKNKNKQTKNSVQISRQTTVQGFLGEAVMKHEMTRDPVVQSLTAWSELHHTTQPCPIPGLEGLGKCRTTTESKYEQSQQLESKSNQARIIDRQTDRQLWGWQCPGLTGPVLESTSDLEQSRISGQEKDLYQ